jgi:hypothetical protein
MIIAVIVMAYTTSIRFFTEEVTRSEILSEGGKGIDRMVKEIREAHKVLNAQPQSISFWYDVNTDSSLEASEIISYSKQGSILLRTTEADSTNIAQAVTALSFSYDSPTNAKLVTIILTVGSGPSLGSFESKVRLRNFDDP